jgi:hypothetical protein
LAGLVGEFEPDRSPRILLAYGRSIHRTRKSLRPVSCSACPTAIISMSLQR